MKQTTKQRQKRKTALLVAAWVLALCLPSRAWAQNGVFDHESYGNSYTGSFIHQGYGSGFTGTFTHEAFGCDFSGTFTHEGFGQDYIGNFNHEFFGDDYIGNFDHEGFGNNVPLGSGLLVLVLASVGYAGIKRKGRR